MNVLAHAYLSHDNDEWLLGGYIADDVKGRAFHSYSKDIRQGILLHRAIDRFTDNHVIVKHATDALKPKYKRYSGVILDMFFDHFLSKYWTLFSQKPLNIFAKSMYVLILKNYMLLPLKTKMLIPFMVYNNWLVSYGSLEGLNKRLCGMASRTRFSSGMEKASTELAGNYKFYKTQFMKFFPELINFVETEKRINSQPLLISSNYPIYNE